MGRLSIFVIVLAVLLLFAGNSIAQQAGSDLTVERMVIATGIESREPIGVNDLFPSTTQKVYCFIEARNIQTDTAVTFVWSLNGKEVHRYSTSLKSGIRWRTYSEKTIYGMTGEWKVELVDPNGNVIKSAAFRVE